MSNGDRFLKLERDRREIHKEVSFKPVKRLEVELLTSFRSGTGILPNRGRSCIYLTLTLCYTKEAVAVPLFTWAARTANGSVDVKVAPVKTRGVHQGSAKPQLPARPPSERSSCSHSCDMRTLLCTTTHGTR